jgi:hypothetical protein
VVLLDVKKGASKCHSRLSLLELQTVFPEEAVLFFQQHRNCMGLYKASVKEATRMEAERALSRAVGPFDCGFTPTGLGHSKPGARKSKVPAPIARDCRQRIIERQSPA